MQAYETMYAELREKHYGQFMAISEGQVVDCDNRF